MARGVGCDRHPGGPWTVEDPARETGLSRVAFVRRFATIVGQPPLAYLTWWRMMTVARLLRESKAPLSTVAERCPTQEPVRILADRTLGPQDRPRPPPATQEDLLDS
nr:helix-turn-helix domain-containing protein [Frankia sp. CiP3]